MAVGTVLSLEFFGAGRKRKIQELAAREAVLKRWIGSCEQALENCNAGAEEVPGYRAARDVRRLLLRDDLVTHRLELDSVSAQMQVLTAPPISRDSGRAPRMSWRRRRVAGAIAGVLLLLAAALPIEHGLDLIPTLIATEEIIEVHPRVLGSVAYPTVEARPAR